MDTLIYLDAGFIARKYEEILNVPPEAQFSRTEGGKADIGFSFAKAGVHTQETLMFKKSSIGMLKELLPALEKNYPSNNLSGFKNYSGTRILWVEGVMSIQTWGNPEDSSIRYDYYGLKVGDRDLAMISSPSYFSSGFSEVVNASDALIGHVGIPVRALVRLLWHVETTKEYVSVPYIVIEKYERGGNISMNIRQVCSS